MLSYQITLISLISKMPPQRLQVHHTDIRANYWQVKCREISCTEIYRVDCTIPQNVVPQIGASKGDVGAAVSTATSQEEGPRLKACWAP